MWKWRIIHWLARRSITLRRRAVAPIPRLEEVRHLTVMKLDAIGDFILSTAFLRPLAERLPDGRVTLVVRKPNGALARQQFPGWQVVELPSRETTWRNVFGQPEARRQLKALPEADLLVNLRAYRDYSDAMVDRRVPARCKVALVNAFPPARQYVAFPKEHDVYDVLLPPVPPLAGEAQDLANHRVMAQAVMGVEAMPGPARPRLIVPSSTAAEVARMLEASAGILPGEPYCVVAPGTSGPIKEYPVAKLAVALRAALSKPGSPRIVITGSPADLRTTAPLSAALGSFGKAFDATGMFSLPQYVALLAAARMAVVMDSSHVHFAGALGLPAVAVLGGGQFGEFGPWGESASFRWVSQHMDCYGCDWRCIYDQARCIVEIEPERVAEAIRGVLAASTC